MEINRVEYIETPKSIEPVKKIEPISQTTNNKKPDQGEQYQQQKIREKGKGDLIDVEI